jgi:hypothetical protein
MSGVGSIIGTMKITLDVNKYEAELLSSRQITDEQWVVICEKMVYSLDWFLGEEIRDILEEMTEETN